MRCINWKDSDVLHSVLPHRNGHVTGRARLPFSSTHPVCQLMTGDVISNGNSSLLQSLN